MKIALYLRAFSGFAFIMLMLVAVFKDMKYFLIILLWILIGFSFSCTFFIFIFNSLYIIIKEYGRNLKHLPYALNFSFSFIRRFWQF